jgi:osmotically-inducible protein OsmY
MRTIIFVLAFALAVGSATVAAAQTPAVPSDADGAAATEIEHRLSNDKTVNAQMIEIDVRGGVATLKGHVPDQDAKERAEKLAGDVPNVKSVRNDITVGHPDAPDLPVDKVPGDR